MYACDSIYFKREQRKKGLFKTIVPLIILAVTVISFLLKGFLDKTNTPEMHTLLKEETITQTMSNLPEEDEIIAQTMEEVSAGDDVIISEEAEAPLIVIDPGHGGMDEGCSRDGKEEKEYNLEMSLMLKEKLEELGFRVILTRSGDEEVGLSERVQIATGIKADMFISIHQNASECTEAEGVETW